jgi:N-ethylmaleimide reductase
MKNSLLTKALNIFMAGTFYSTQKAKNALRKVQQAKNNAYELISTPMKLGSVNLKNRIIMSTITRCNAIGNKPNEIMTEYYAQRSGAGLIITEGTSPSPNGLGYARIPGIFSKRQIDAWENTTSAVHKGGGKIFVKLMHTGRISHPLNMPIGAVILAPSAIKAEGKIWTDSKKMQDFPIPKEMTTEDMWQAKIEFVTAARNAMKAGFDGVELNAGNGYLLEQFLSPTSNIRKDNYGGSIENRCRFVLEVLIAISAAI